MSKAIRPLFVHGLSYTLFISACICLLISCVSSAPTQYAQGIPTAPPAPSFNPAWDAPHTVGQPGYVGPVENLPRSPYTRTLPQTPATRREAGLWSGDTQASSPMAPNDPVVLDVRLPFSPHASSEVEEAPTRLCAGTLRAALAKAGVADIIRSKAQPLRRCLVAKAYKHCSEKLSALAPHAAPPPGATRDEWARATEAVRHEAARFEDMLCRDLQATKDDLIPAIRWLKTWEQLP